MIESLICHENETSNSNRGLSHFWLLYAHGLTWVHCVWFLYSHHSVLYPWSERSNCAKGRGFWIQPWMYIHSHYHFWKMMQITAISVTEKIIFLPKSVHVNQNGNRSIVFRIVRVKNVIQLHFLYKLPVYCSTKVFVFPIQDVRVRFRY